MPSLRNFFGRAGSEAAAYALGIATGPVLVPAVEEVKNAAWRELPTRALEADDAAEIVAEDVELRDWGAHEAAAHGVNGERFDALVGAVLNAPGMGELLQARRRGLITEAQFRHGLRKARLESLWDDAMAGLVHTLLSVSELANAVVQGHLPQDEATARAALLGYAAPDFEVLVANTGLPPGPETLLAWRRRGFITDAQLDQGIREGHTKTKYIPYYHDALANVLSHTTYANLHLRGWISQQQMYDGGALTGYTPEQMDLEYLNRGRPATVHQIHIGYARGAELPGVANEEAAIRRAVAQSDIRPEYANLLYAGRYSLPSAFALRGLVSSGAITAARGEQILVQSGWPPDLAAEVAAFWAHPSQTTATINPRLKRAQDQIYNAAHGSYIADEITREQALAALEKIGVPADVSAQVVDLWDYEDSITVRALTPTQIKKGYAENKLTHDQALDRLVALNMLPADAELFLQE